MCWLRSFIRENNSHNVIKANLSKIHTILQFNYRMTFCEKHTLKVKKKLFENGTQTLLNAESISA